MKILTTREWATAIWGIVFFVCALANKQIRKSLWNILKIFFDKKLRILWEIILLYVLVITVVFSYLPFWDIVYIKDIAIWFIFSGFVLCMNAMSREADEKYISMVLKDNLKSTIVIEFIISTFTFDIWVELAMVPIISIVVIMDVIAERKEEYNVAHKLFQAFLYIAGLWILLETIKVGIHEYRELNVIHTFVSFMIPISYLLLIIPLLYAIELYSKYELLFVRMSFKEEKNSKIHRRHCLLVMKECKFSVRRVLLFQKEYCCKMYIRMSEDEFIHFIDDFKKQCNDKRNEDICKY
ncbi:hypothetical protein KYB31_23435 [Clostridium felsineum]|uniref:hypothetical protein n=1 Tax=Clostridium felsineum TaxID=36839 RepID=UPI00214D33B9|nr:hypothetical protein [Clostridium felsineum]MCR3761928.1 hypothetical protein [Clostridium felsineum]